MFVRFFSDAAGRRLTATDQILYEVSQMYNTEYTTRYLANVLLKNDDCAFIDQVLLKVKRRRLPDQEVEINYGVPIWSHIALSILQEWADTTSGESIELLRAIKFTKWYKSEAFQKVLTCGKYLFAVSVKFVKQFVDFFMAITLSHHYKFGFLFFLFFCFSAP